MQHEVTRAVELLDDRGRLVAPGWARHAHWRYDPARVAAPWWRIKEWDYFLVLDEEHGEGVAITCSDLGYAGLYAVCRVDVDGATTHQVDALRLLTRHRTGLATDADVDHEVAVEARELALRLARAGDQRRLTFEAPGLAGDLVLHQPPDVERMAIATHWPGDPTSFYYNQKLVGMPAEGTMTVDGRDVRFGGDGSHGILDWGRGRWTYRNQWYWSAAAGTVDGVRVGFNLGYGFSDRTPASENVIVHDGRIHKLGQVTFFHDPGDWLAPWRLRDTAGRLDLRLAPTVDRSADTNLLVIRSDQHQVFGRFHGTLVLDDGSPVAVDGLPGFAEAVANRW